MLNSLETQPISVRLFSVEPLRQSTRAICYQSFGRRSLTKDVAPLASYHQEEMFGISTGSGPLRCMYLTIPPAHYLDENISRIEFGIFPQERENFCVHLKDVCTASLCGMQITLSQEVKQCGALPVPPTGEIWNVSLHRLLEINFPTYSLYPIKNISTKFFYGWRHRKQPGALEAQTRLYNDIARLSAGGECRFPSNQQVLEFCGEKFGAASPDKLLSAPFA
ncbi:hypothetical protein RRG08_017481 [Elysia crispata]|uniref:Uncharacterized protein n=1 Tax=Elysia crispata TaxID=231223 RepID=A0AAE1CZN9_9GAST|nr:hypothetical protein RRG08_017481 [Elysia crispata]